MAAASAQQHGFCGLPYPKEALHRRSLGVSEGRWWARRGTEDFTDK